MSLDFAWSLLLLVSKIAFWIFLVHKILVPKILRPIIKSMSDLKSDNENKKIVDYLFPNQNAVLGLSTHTAYLSINLPYSMKFITIPFRQFKESPVETLLNAKELSTFKSGPIHEASGLKCAMRQVLNEEFGTKPTELVGKRKLVSLTLAEAGITPTNGDTAVNS